MKEKFEKEFFEGKRVTILGCGKSGLESALALKKAGAYPFISDVATIQEEYKSQLIQAAIPFEENGHTERVFQSDLIVVSPGIKPNSEVLRKSEENGIPIIGELELGYMLTAGEYIAITGTNGKSTVTTLTYELLKTKEDNVIACGNIGEPLSMFAFNKATFVLEVSSFQLKTTKTFKPDIGVILNIDQDHMDWHPTFDDYVDSKARIFENQDPNDFLILNYDDPVVKGLSQRARSKVLWVSVQEKVENGVYYDEKSQKVYFVENGKEWEVFQKSDLLIKGIHNIFNAGVSSLIGILRGMEISEIRTVLRNFKGLPHRIEFVLEHKGVKFYDDSKGTNPHAVLWALKGFEEPVILIMGGEDKDLDFAPLREIVKEKCKLIIAIGKAKNKMINTFSDLIPVIPATDMKDAVEKAFENAKMGDAVLLSPGCASFDMFKNYKERGDVFQHWVRETAKAY